MLHVQCFLYHLSPQWTHHLIDSCPSGSFIHLLQAISLAPFLHDTLIWGNWLVRGVWHHTKQYYLTLPSLIRAGTCPTQSLSWISYMQNTGPKKKKKQDCGKHLWQQPHQWPTFCICIIINLLCQIWFSWRADIPYKKHTLQITEEDDSFRQCWKRGGKGRLQCAALTCCTM